MPQIWMTYEELESMLDCPVAEARERAHLERLDRKISHDGKTRAKLSVAMTGIFIERLKTIDYDIDRVVNNLRLVHGLLSECVDQSAQLGRHVRQLLRCLLRIMGTRGRALSGLGHPVHVLGDLTGPSGGLDHVPGHLVCSGTLFFDGCCNRIGDIAYLVDDPADA